MQFIDPPKRRHRQRSEHWDAIAQELRDNPNEWGRVWNPDDTVDPPGTYSPGVATHLRHGKYPSFIPTDLDNAQEKRRYMNDNWEVTTRKSKDRCEIYIRYVGE